MIIRYADGFIEIRFERNEIMFVSTETHTHRSAKVRFRSHSIQRHACLDALSALLFSNHELETEDFAPILVMVKVTVRFPCPQGKIEMELFVMSRNMVSV